MTLQVPQPARRTRPLPPFATRETLQSLPMRQLPASSPDTEPLHWERIDVDRYDVRLGTKRVGFIDVVGAVFVVLAGNRYSRATEVAQTLVFEDALAALT